MGARTPALHRKQGSNLAGSMGPRSPKAPPWHPESENLRPDRAAKLVHPWITEFGSIGGSIRLPAVGPAPGICVARQGGPDASPAQR